MSLRLRLRMLAGKPLLVVVVLASAGAATLGLWAAFQAVTKPAPQLAAMLPQGALLTIESNDFAALLKQWNESPEKSAWLKSDNYSVFSNSRLFGRLGSAQDEFAVSAGLPPDLSFLKEVAGTRSIFAWYDIGNLEFLYITHMPSAAAQQTRLLQMRNKFATRQVGGQTFYVRTQADSEHSGQARTVAFATAGEWLLLATREDLIAGALTLIGSPNAANSLTSEAWFADAQTAVGKDQGQLHMTLNLEKIVPTPYFRSYWIQRNITEMKQFRSAVADLHMEGGAFREERVLLPKSSQSAQAETDSYAGVDLASLLQLLPKHSGVYRAQAMPTADAAITSLNEKLLQRGTDSYSDARFAPTADLSVQQAGQQPGSTSDLETRIDAAPMAQPAKGAELLALRHTFDDAGLQALMTVSRTAAARDNLWVPFQSAVVLVSAANWDTASMQAALQQALQANLTTGGLGLAWKPVHAASGSGDYFEISAARPLELAIQGKLCIVADSPELMQEMLARVAAKPTKSEASPTRPTLVAGFELGDERASFARWTKLVDRNGSGGQAALDADGNNSSGTEPAFFSQNLRSLGDVFAALDSEHLVERRNRQLTRQTVTYQWRR